MIFVTIQPLSIGLHSVSMTSWHESTFVVLIHCEEVRPKWVLHACSLVEQKHYCTILTTLSGRDAMKHSDSTRSRSTTLIERWWP